MWLICSTQKRTNSKFVSTIQLNHMVFKLGKSEFVSCSCAQCKIKKTVSSHLRVTRHHYCCRPSFRGQLQNPISSVEGRSTFDARKISHRMIGVILWVHVKILIWETKIPTCTRTNSCCIYYQPDPSISLQNVLVVIITIQDPKNSFSLQRWNFFHWLSGL